MRSPMRSRAQPALQTPSAIHATERAPGPTGRDRSSPACARPHQGLRPQARSQRQPGAEHPCQVRKAPRLTRAEQKARDPKRSEIPCHASQRGKCGPRDDDARQYHAHSPSGHPEGRLAPRIAHTRSPNAPKIMPSSAFPRPRSAEYARRLVKRPRAAHSERCQADRKGSDTVARRSCGHAAGYLSACGGVQAAGGSDISRDPRIPVALAARGGRESSR